MDNFVSLNYYEVRALLDYLKGNLLSDIVGHKYNKDDAGYLLSALLKFQNMYDKREKQIACCD